MPRYHPYKNKRGGYWRGRNRAGRYYTSKGNPFLALGILVILGALLQVIPVVVKALVEVSAAFFTQVIKPFVIWSIRIIWVFLGTLSKSFVSLTPTQILILIILLIANSIVFGLLLILISTLISNSSLLGINHWSC
jgi:hypothetical protein